MMARGVVPCRGKSVSHGGKSHFLVNTYEFLAGIQNPATLIEAAMAKLGAATGGYRQIESYRALAKEALESVAIYNARAQWFECSGNVALAAEYRLLSQEALTRATRYKELADAAERHSGVAPEPKEAPRKG